MCKEIIEAREEAKKITNVLGMHDKADLDIVVNYLENKFDCKIETVRFNFAQLAKKLDMPELTNAGGYVLKEKNQFTIAINSLLMPTFQRFAIAHELGHIALNHMSSESRMLSFLIKYDLDDIPMDLCKSDSYFMNEQSANAFALELLLPNVDNDDVVQYGGIEKTALKYNVSEEAVKAKIKKG